jgi:hypothetical protein
VGGTSVGGTAVGGTAVGGSAVGGTGACVAAAGAQAVRMTIIHRVNARILYSFFIFFSFIDIENNRIYIRKMSILGSSFRLLIIEYSYSVP